MGRNTKIEELQFPVKLKPVYVKRNKNKMLTNYSAVTGIINKKENIFSVVSRNYALVLNNEAIVLGRRIMKEMFPEAGEDNLIVFNLNYPETRSYCHIDLINENYTFNIWEKEVYVPFLRITNSYNKSRKLGFEIGFVRKVCDNGVIFEREIVRLNYFHYNKTLNNFSDSIISDSKMKKLKEIEKSFTEYMRNLKEIIIAKEYFTGITAKIFGLKFSKENVSTKYSKILEKQKEEFVNIMEKLKQMYTSELGENAYSLFNTATAFANETGFVKCGRYNSFQTKTGKWVREIVRINKERKIQEYLKNCKDYLN
ncbi:MAG: hypothetical protein JNJ56_10440 [Ignavibacteria bacterium]|nr:hypothetical protein [Ignavibacteria bacterium]